MKFKLRDKVKLIHFPYKSMVGQIGVVIEVRSCGYSFPYKVKFSDFFRPAVFEKEIELVLIKNQQLEFPFME